MYEEEHSKCEMLVKENKLLRLDKANLKQDVENLTKHIESRVQMEVKKAVSPLMKDIDILQSKLSGAYQEIDRLKSQIAEYSNNEDKDYIIDKLTNQLNKNSTNSGIPTSKEIGRKRTGVNTYNHRTKTAKKAGGQLGHKGVTLTKERLEEKIKTNNIPVKEIVHYLNGSSSQEDIIKYKIGIIVDLYVEKHIFKHAGNSKKVLPKEYYSNVTYSDDLKALIVALGNYYSLGYSKIKEFIFDLSDGIIDISEGTIDNIYEEFSDKSEETLNNITTNILNGKYSHTDETTTSENGKETYYRGYANPTNVLYKYHQHKGDAPIKEDNILTRYFGTIISDHESGIFKYGTNNQDCIIHIGRYCIEGDQNILETEWQIDLYRFLLKLDRQRKILMNFGKTSFTKKEIEKIEKEFDEILKIAEEQNKNISSIYWRKKATTLLRRFKKYKNTMLFFIYDFSIPSENNFMERCLRMIKGKTKISGGFRSTKGGERFGNIMSIIKTAKLRKLNPFNCIKAIYQGKSLFA